LHALSTQSITNMRTLQFLLFTVLGGFLLPAIADIDHYFETIKSDPHALYTFLKDMPKSGELHYHLAGGAYPETMLALAIQEDYCLNLKTHTISKATPCDGIKTVDLTNQRDLHPAIIQAWSMKNFIPGQESSHDHFFASFLKFMPLVFDYRPQLLAEIMQRAAAQHELYLEIMILPDNAVSTSFGELANRFTGYAAKQRALLANQNFNANLNHTVTESSRILKQARQELGCNTQPMLPACAITLKFQYYILREQPLDNVFAQALNGFIASTQSKDLVGVNLVQAENGVISLRDYKQQMQIFNFLHTAYPKVNIALHAGELSPSLVKPSELNFHIHDAIFTGHAKRIGHGVDIAHEQGAEALLKHMAHTPIPVEINLTSNRKILAISGKRHPLNYYLEHHVPVVLSTDDEGILRTNLTSEYVEAVINHHLDYRTVKTINRNALSYSFLPGKSLWIDQRKQIAVQECQNFTSKACLEFIKENEKARLQWQLESKLTAFEKKYSH
jgi:adenosine deaminase